MGPPRRLRVLVASDDQDCAYSTAVLLQLVGHQTAVAFDGDDAVRKARALTPDAILLDIGLPGSNSHEVARQIIGLCLAPPPLLVVVTGDGALAVRQRASGVGFILYLTKPVDPAHLLTILDQFSLLARAGTTAGAGEPGWR